MFEIDKRIIIDNKEKLDSCLLKVKNNISGSIIN